MHFTVANIIREQAAAQPGARCITFEGATASFSDVDRRSSQVANALIAAGVSAGDRVAVLMKNHPSFYELLFGCAKVNAQIVGLNWRLTASELEPIFDDADPALLIVGAEQRALVPEQRLQNSMMRVVTIEEDYEAWVQSASPVDPRVVPGPDDVAFILYTSGTTGLPKGAMLTHRNMSFTMRTAREVWGFTSSSTNLVAMPLFHIGGMGYGLMAVGQGGHTVVVRDADAAALIRAIERHRVTHTFFVPAVIQAVVSAPEAEAADLSSLELIVYGAAPISETLLREGIETLGCRFTQAYGMTETAGTVVSLAPEDHDPGGPRAHLLGSCGKRLPWLTVGVFDPDRGVEVETGNVGEIWVRSEQNMKGYRNNPAATAETITTSGWLRTGDAAYQDGDGYLFLYDRFKDMIVSGGENVFPAEVENVISAHPMVSEVAVIGVPHERWGETVKAIVVPRAGAVPDEADVVAFARERLARYKCPTSVDFVTVLPRNASGKILKKELREPYWRGAERRIH